MSYTKTITDADSYFAPANHGRSQDWLLHDVLARTGALAQAKRELEAYLNRSLVDPGTNIFGDFSNRNLEFDHDDYAHFEQALEILDRQPRQVVGSKVKKLGEPKEDDRKGFRISPIALNFARVPRLKMVRG